MLLLSVRVVLAVVIHPQWIMNNEKLHVTTRFTLTVCQWVMQISKQNFLLVYRVLKKSISNQRYVAHTKFEWKPSYLPSLYILTVHWSQVVAAHIGSQGNEQWQSERSKLLLGQASRAMFLLGLCVAVRLFFRIQRHRHLAAIKLTITLKRRWLKVGL